MLKKQYKSPGLYIAKASKSFVLVQLTKHNAFITLYIMSYDTSLWANAELNAAVENAISAKDWDAGLRLCKDVDRLYQAPSLCKGMKGEILDKTVLDTSHMEGIRDYLRGLVYSLRIPIAVGVYKNLSPVLHMTTYLLESMMKAAYERGVYDEFIEQMRLVAYGLHNTEELVRLGMSYTSLPRPLVVMNEYNTKSVWGL